MTGLCTTLAMNKTLLQSCIQNLLTLAANSVLKMRQDVLTRYVGHHSLKAGVIITHDSHPAQQSHCPSLHKVSSSEPKGIKICTIPSSPSLYLCQRKPSRLPV